MACTAAISISIVMVGRRHPAPAEDVGEAQDVVDLVPGSPVAGGHDGVVAHGAHPRRDFRVRVGQREDQRAGPCFTISA